MFGQSLKGGQEHSALGGIDRAVDVQKSLETKDMIIGVGCPIIPLARDFEVCEGLFPFGLQGR